MKENKLKIKIFLGILGILLVGGTIYVAIHKNTGESATLSSMNADSEIIPVVPDVLLNTAIQENQKGLIKNTLSGKNYVSNKYNFDFTYPTDWSLEEKSLPDFYGTAIGKDFYRGIAVVMTNPDIPKIIGDCCYTKEEFEKYATRPVLVLRIIEAVTYPANKDFFGPKTKDIFNQLLVKGYPPKTAETLLAFVPSVGENIDANGQPTAWKDVCNNIALMSIDNRDVITFSGCPEGAWQNAGALFARKDGLILSLQDEGSFYSREGDFDTILQSFKFR